MSWEAIYISKLSWWKDAPDTPSPLEVRKVRRLPLVPLQKKILWYMLSCNILEQVPTIREVHVYSIISM